MATWLNEPKYWSEAADGTRLRMTTEPGTDFWRRTHYGFERDSGHFLGHRVAGDFDAEVAVAGAFRTLYDQCGLMVRVDGESWMKCGIEFVDGRQYASAVVTRGFSDWSVAPIAAPPPAVRFRVTRRADALEVSWSIDGAGWTLLRLAHLPMPHVVAVGPMAASPGEAGFEVVFEGFAVVPPAIPA